ncbi:hypothetical protein MXE73_06990 [Enterococcus faecalis]|uniref:hypothetical protein n=1 Tax=Enterococcus faecalis TaxID=1351 RepID=UPI002DB96C12|nr:hypothetical protein [Enterococcus faecalis]MEB6043224.1 hypothetical protein [Enterococcus faecalis]MEB6173018.1 hypothetical protein [Enterococcus faecalis]
MSTGRLVINGKTWGEFESAKRIKGHIVISGYESYGGCHTVRGIKQPELNKNQQIVLDWLKEEMKKENMFPISCLWELQSWHAPKNVCSAYLALDKDRQFQLLSAFIEWSEQEENSVE